LTGAPKGGRYDAILFQGVNEGMDFSQYDILILYKIIPQNGLRIIFLEKHLSQPLPFLEKLP
jgi:hypothetical protein